MPKRRPAISDDVLMRELDTLPDGTLVMPTQVKMVTGLSERDLLDRRRTDPPTPPFPEPRDPGKSIYWYSLGTLRAYRASLKESAEIKAELQRQGYENQRGFSAWLSTPGIKTRWPCAIVGPHKRPVDIFATIRGEVVMTHSDKVAWLTRKAFLDALASADVAEAIDQDIALAKKTAAQRQRQSSTKKKMPAKDKGRRFYS